MTPEDIKALGTVWGAQHGLLSIAELGVLMDVCQDPRIGKVLEVGHYFGLSTCAIVYALRARGGTWSMLSVDAHISDPWVNIPARVEDFQNNRRAYFDDERLSVSFDRSETITAIDADFVFYDGDHGDEQMRFTKAVIASPSVRTFLFDDRDFDVPRKCTAALVAAGWRSRSPHFSRQPADKMNPKTQTLAWFERT